MFNIQYICININSGIFIRIHRSMFTQVSIKCLVPRTSESVNSLVVADCSPPPVEAHSRSCEWIDHLLFLRLNSHL